MKKLIDVLNPFVLLLVPVIAAVVLGISHQLHQQHQELINGMASAKQAIPLFDQGVHFFKALCSFSQQNVW